MHHPSLGLFGDRGLFGAVISVFQRSAATHRQRLVDPFINALAGHAHRPRNLRNVFAGMVTQHHARPLGFPPGRGPRIPQTLEPFEILLAQGQSRSLRPARHTLSLASNMPMCLCFIETIYSRASS